MAEAGTRNHIWERDNIGENIEKFSKIKPINDVHSEKFSGSDKKITLISSIQYKKLLYYIV